MKSAIKRTALGIVIAAILYATLAWSNFAPIAYYRTLYIETAMSTMTKQWLATSFIPKKVIREVMEKKESAEKKQDELVEQWKDVKIFDPTQDSITSETKANIVKLSDYSDGDYWKESVHNLYKEIDKSSLSDYVSKNKLSYSFLDINKSLISDDNTGIVTALGDNVAALDTANGILIIEIDEPKYKGKLAIVKDSAKVKIGVAPNYGETGSLVRDIANHNNAILAINASGFTDPEGFGDGGEALGLFVGSGKVYSTSISKNWVMVGYDWDNNLRIGKYSDISLFRDAVEFTPAIVLNGEKAVKDTAGWGIAPRTILGQNKDGESMLLVVDGRRVGYSLGATMEECADILIKYGAFQAAAMDGGSSSVMVYKGQEITRPSTKREVGRRVPNGVVVEYTVKETIISDTSEIEQIHGLN